MERSPMRTLPPIEVRAERSVIENVHSDEVRGESATWCTFPLNTCLASVKRLGYEKGGCLYYVEHYVRVSVSEGTWSGRKTVRLGEAKEEEEEKKKKTPFKTQQGASKNRYRCTLTATMTCPPLSMLV